VVVVVVIHASSYIYTCTHTHIYMCVCACMCVYIATLRTAVLLHPSQIKYHRGFGLEGCFVWGKLCWHQWWASYGLRTALSLLWWVVVVDQQQQQPLPLLYYIMMGRCIMVAASVHVHYYVFRPSISDNSFGRKKERWERENMCVCVCVRAHAQYTSADIYSHSLSCSLLAYGPQLFVLTGHLKLVWKGANARHIYIYTCGQQEPRLWSLSRVYV